MPQLLTPIPDAPAQIGTGAIDLLISDSGAPSSTLMYPLTVGPWPGPAGSRVWWRVNLAAHWLQVTVRGGDPVPHPLPIPCPGPDWQSATVLYLRNAPTVMIVSDQRFVWSPLVPAPVCPLLYSLRDPSILTVCLPS